MVENSDEAGSSLPASHRASALPLPPLPATLYRGGGQTTTSDVDDAISQWLSDDSSNLLAVMGDFGAGKTTTIRRLAASLVAQGRQAFYMTYDSIASKNAAGFVDAQLGSAEIAIVDGYDSLNLLEGPQIAAPDLRHLDALIRKTRKVVIATRRTSKYRGDELIRQLFKSSRYEKFQVRNPTLVELQPWDLDAVTRAAERANHDPLLQVCRYLGTVERIARRHLLRPLLLAMMVAINEGSSRTPSLTIGKLYDEYVETVLTSDFDNRRSRLTEVHKRSIVSDLAYDIFTAVDQDSEGSERFVTDSISYSRISTRVIEVVTSDPQLSARSDSSKYEWTHDFLATVHLLNEVVSSYTSLVDRSYRFTHGSFYEYFVAQAMLKRIAGGHSLGLRPRAFSVAIFDSLAIYFVRTALDEMLLDSIERMVRRQRISWPDRMLLLYLLEDHEDFRSILQTAPAEYITQISEASQTAESFYLRKLMWYQLVTLDLHSAYDYVAAARINEEDSDLSHESLNQSGESDITGFLLRRLQNPRLARAIPITVYRLGQLANRTALPALEILQCEDPRLASLRDESIQRITRRLERTESQEG